MKTIIIIVISIISLILFENHAYTQESLLQLELILQTVNGPPQLHFTMVSIIPIIWEAHRSYIHSVSITTDPDYIDPGDIVMPGIYSGRDKGWNTDAYPYPDPLPPVLGRGYYEMSVPSQNGTATLFVNCYGTYYQYEGVDATILYDYKGNKGNGAFFINGRHDNTVVLYENANGLQPTPPPNFHCTNAGQIGHHPQFAWSAPEEPDGVTFYYNIYRDLGAGYRKITANPLTATEYIDTSIEIIKFGSNTAHYYVTAKGSESPESEASDIVAIKTNTAEKMLPQQEMPDNTAANYIEPAQIRLLGNHPNPFNSTTMIQYSLPQPSHVTLKIFNLQGEVVKTLVAGNQTANHYQVLWHGENEIGEKVAAGIYLYHLATDNYSQIKRMIFIK